MYLMPIELPTTIVIGVVCFIFAYLATKYKGAAIQLFFLFIMQGLMLVLVGVMLTASSSNILGAAYAGLVFSTSTTTAYMIIKLLMDTLKSATKDSFEMGELGEG